MWWRHWIAAAVGLATPLMLTPAPAAADEPQPFSRSVAGTYQVSFAARECPSYADVAANQVREDVPESAVPPGRASDYQPGQLVDPDVEARAGCAPLAGVRFTLGSGRQRTGPLSTVTGAAEPVTTLAETPRLDATGKATAGSLTGGVTVPLTVDQVRLATVRQLWAQGGTPTEPTPAGHAFALLRCAADGRTAGNTEWVSFPDRVRHVFCFAYYVRGVPAAGTVTVRARSTRPAGYPQRFGFSSNLSPAGRFTLAGGAGGTGETGETSFVRAAGATRYTVQPQLPPGWRVAGASCTGGKASADKTTGRAVLTVTDGGSVICTYAFEPPPAVSGLGLRAYAEGGAATFGVLVDGANARRTLTVTPRGDGSAAPATGADLRALPAGAYTVTVQPPAGQAEQWSLAAAACHGTPVPVRGWTVAVALDAGTPRDCVLKLARKQGGLTLTMLTSGGVATGGFAILPADTAAAGWGLSATTTGYDTPAEATGDLPTVHGPGRYLVMAIPPPSTMDGGWRLTRFACDPAASPAAGAGLVQVELTPAHPDVRCTANYDPVPAHRLRVTLRADGSAEGRSSSAVLDITCIDGSTGRVVLRASDTAPSELPEPLSLAEPTTCTATQPSTGAFAGAQTSSVAILDPGTGDQTLALPATISFAAGMGQYTLAVTTTYLSPVDHVRHRGPLPPFGSLPMTLIGSGMMGIGALTLFILVFRRRAAY